MCDTPTPKDGHNPELLKEDCVSFAKAARKLPKVRGNKHLAPSTLWRWAKNGRRTGSRRLVHLEWVRVGGTNCTSMEALLRFFYRLNDEEPRPDLRTPTTPHPSNTPRTATTTSPEANAQCAMEELRRRGRLK